MKQSIDNTISARVNDATRFHSGLRPAMRSSASTSAAPRIELVPIPLPFGTSADIAISSPPREKSNFVTVSALFTSAPSCEPTHHDEQQST